MSLEASFTDTLSSLFVGDLFDPSAKLVREIVLMSSLFEV